MSGEAPFCELLRQQRRAAGYSQEDLAERAGLSAAAIGSLEQGLRRAPHRDTVRSLADALDVSESERLELEEAAARARGRQPRGDSGLPASLTSFIERDEVAELKALLTDHRLLTVTGSGGVGKTRIAIEVARRVEPLHDEICFVDLLPVRDGRLVASHVAARLNVPLEGEDGLSAVVRRLRPRCTLLVLDNCEHVIVDAAVLVGDLLRRCPSLTVLATSREPLALSGELAYRLPSMEPSNATDLFVARAQVADRAFSLDGQHLTVIAEICRELDGIPLAIELAASRVSALGLESLRKRLKGGITLTGSRDFPPRHQTMSATIAWSYDLLSDVDRLLFQRLSVFFGSFTLEVAEEICSDGSLPSAIIADGLVRLAQKSLINVEPTGTSMRYQFLDSIRAFAWNRLSDGGQLEKSMLRLIEWFTERAAPLELTMPAALFAELRGELDSVAAAVSWAQSTADYPTIVSASQLLIRFRRVWFGTSRHLEFRTLGFGLLEQLKQSESHELIGLLINAMAAFLTGPELLTQSERAIPLLAASGHSAYAADLHSRCASVECVRGDAAAAESHLVEGEAMLTPDERRRSRTGFSFASNGAYVRCLLKNFAGARALLDGLEIPPGDPYEVEIRLVLAEIEFCEKHVEKAIELLRDAKLGLERYPNAKELGIVISSGLTEYQLSFGNARAAEKELREALTAADRECELWFATGIVNLARYAAFFAATAGRIDLASRLLGACDQRSNPASLEDDSTSRDLAVKAIEANASSERAEALRRNGATEDLFELIEEFLAQPAAADNARPSATSSPRATRVTRSSPN